jgi:alpha-amylase/alpha-mannosidase (GH57 family)
VIDVVFYFQVHQPYRLRHFRPGDRIKKLDYFDTGLNRLVVERVAERGYLPMNRVLLEAIERTDGQFRCAFSLSGTVIQQLKDWAPKALESFVELAESGNVEFLCETSEHSIAAVEDLDEFADPRAGVDHGHAEASGYAAEGGVTSEHRHESGQPRRHPGGQHAQRALLPERETHE